MPKALLCSGWVIFGHFWNVYSVAAALMVIRLRSFVSLSLSREEEGKDGSRARAIHWERAKKQHGAPSINDVRTWGEGANGSFIANRITGGEMG